MGRSSSVTVEEVRLPTPAGGDVCVRVRYAGINPLDWKLVEGHYRWMSKRARRAVSASTSLARFMTPAAAPHGSSRACGSPA